MEAVDDRPMNSAQAAEYLQLNYLYFLRLAKAGKIKGYRLGSQWRFYKRDLDAALKEWRPDDEG
jgi:excisionase family DNA binding protein